MAGPHTHKLTLLSGMAMLLQSCSRETELYDVIYWYLPQIFSHVSGRICLQEKNTQTVIPVFEWGKPSQTAVESKPLKCEVLKKGLPVSSRETSVACCAYCVPLKNINGTIGALCVGNPQFPLSEQYRKLALITAEYLSLSVSNIRLNHQLYELTIRDPLTGLYNRRYMDEILEKECERARRAGTG